MKMCSIIFNNEKKYTCIYRHTGAYFGIQNPFKRYMKQCKMYIRIFIQVLKV